MTLAVVIIVSLALLALGVHAALHRRSLVGVVIGIELGAGGLVLLAVTLFDLTGTTTSTGGVFAVALIGMAAGAGGLVAALHVAAARAERRAADLEPW